MTILEKPTAKILDIKSSLKQAHLQADLTFTELGIHGDKELVDIKLEHLKFPPYHSRIPIENRLKSLMDSLETYGFLGGIFVSSKNYNIIDGWYRKEILSVLGHTYVPCFKVDCTEEQEKLLHLKLNTQVATFDFTDFGLTFPGVNLLEDYGFTVADLRNANPSPSRSEKPTKTSPDSSLMRFNTVLQTEQYQKLKAFKKQHALESWSDVAGKREFLTIDEVTKIMNLEIPDKNGFLNRVRDLFIFSCVTGLRYSDVVNLKWANVDTAKNAITVEMTKTKKQITIPLVKQALEILSKYGKHTIKVPSAKVLPQMTNQVINRELKVLIEKAGINKPITFHCARHSFASNLIEAGTPILFVRDLLGHQNLNETQIYAKALMTDLHGSMDNLSSLYKKAV